jgi:hypothetical protein
MNFPSAVNFMSPSPACAPPIYTLPARSVKIVCSDFGQPGTEFGTPQACSRSPAGLNAITAGGGMQHSPAGGLTAAAFSLSSKSRGRLSTQITSCWSTNIPVMPSKVHLFGNSLGQVGSYLYLGGAPGAAPPVAGSPVAIIETPQSPKIAAQDKAKIFPFACIRFPRLVAA